MSPICLGVPGSSVSCWPGCGLWWRRRTPRSGCCGPSCRRRWNGNGGWSCGSPSWNAAWGWTAATRGRRARRSRSGRRGAARPSGRTGTLPSGSVARTASAAGSPGTPVLACPGTPIRMSGRPRIRRRSARDAGRAWPGGSWGLEVGAGLGRADLPVGDRVAAAVAAVPVLREADDRGRAAGRAPGDHFLWRGDQRGRGAAERVRERAVRTCRPADRHAARHGGLAGVRGPGQRPAGREAAGRRVR